MATLPTIDEIKEILGIDAADDSQDDALQNNLDATIAIVERYLCRGVEYKEVVEDFEPVATRNARLHLYRFPVKQVNSVSSESAPGSDVWSALAGWRVFRRQGALEWTNGYGRHYGCCSGSEVVIRVDYAGGYDADEWPADLLDAIMKAFYVRWNSGAGNPGAASSGPPIRMASVDGLSIQYGGDTVTTPESITGRLGNDLSVIPPELMGVAAQLEPYRDRMAGGV